MKWPKFLHADTNLGKLNVYLMILGWVCSKMTKIFWIMGLENQVYVTQDLINWADWLNDFCMLIVIE